MVKKVPDGTQRKKASIRERIEQNRWNPFERVDPEILQRIHKQHEANAKKHLLDKTEDALW